MLARSFELSVPIKSIFAQPAFSVLAMPVIFIVGPRPVRGHDDGHLLLDDSRRQKRIETTFDRRNMIPRPALHWLRTLVDGLPSCPAAAPARLASEQSVSSCLPLGWICFSPFSWSLWLPEGTHLIKRSSGLTAFRLL